MVSSMGIHGLENQPATEQARDVCLRHGIDIAHHRSRPLVPGELKEADLVFTMEIVQRDFVKIFFPVAGDRAFMLAAWPHQEGKKHLIRDPMSRSDRVYQDVFTTIQRHVERVVPLLLSQVAS